MSKQEVISTQLSLIQVMCQSMPEYYLLRLKGIWFYSFHCWESYVHFSSTASTNGTQTIHKTYSRGLEAVGDSMWGVKTLSGPLLFLVVFLKDLARRNYVPQPNQKWPLALGITSLHHLPLSVKCSCGKGCWFLICDFVEKWSTNSLLCLLCLIHGYWWSFWCYRILLISQQNY